MLQTTIRKDSNGHAGATGVKPKHQICKKAQQDVGLFYYLDFLNKRRVCRPGYELKSLKITSINIEKVIKCDMFHTLFFSSKFFL
ncbi:hypothetical protein NI462_14075 [Acinetobacter lwoffii]|uniref:hypothetical protein n=1 Tax=Acinetobacter lwoffii TaxID=28090 RepID=UPI00209ABA84|nr:hypothetical protein [Acinetobacter lwoffii]MCO8098269.1 hypothetical protein [Acinetobacter lwoffii]